MITVVLGLSGAVVYGFADFLGGLASRRLRPIVVTAIAAVVGIVPLLLGLTVLGGRFSAAAVLWGAVGGLAGSVGVLLLYAALAVGPMSVLSPLTAVAAAVVPVAVALARGAVLSPLAGVALLVAVVAVVLVAAVRDRSGARLTARGVVTALVAGCGFGGLVLAYDATPPDSGVAPLLVARLLQAVLLGAAALLVVRSARPGGPAGPAPSARLDGAAGPQQLRRAGPSSARRCWRPTASIAQPTAWIVLACGITDAAANVCIQAALHSSEDPATLPVVSVLNALYPLGTILLAAVVLRERLTVAQALGVVLAFAASVALALA